MVERAKDPTAEKSLTAFTDFSTETITSETAKKYFDTPSYTRDGVKDVSQYDVVIARAFLLQALSRGV